MYNYTDHLGNVRVSYTKDPVDGLTKIVEENNYYPFGMKHANYNDYAPPAPGVANTGYQYKYNEKELQGELGLSWYDYGARNYDATVGRFMNIDRLAEKFESLTPYQYAGNIPTYFIDVNGEYIYINDPRSGEKYRYESGKTQKLFQGKWIEAEDDDFSDFVIMTIAALQNLENSGKTGKGLVDRFSGEGKDVTFQYREYSKGGNEADWKIGSIFLDNKYDAETWTVAGKKISPLYITIGHEMAHLTDPVKYHDPWYNEKVSQGEIRATHIENMIRAESGLPLRTHYGESFSKKDGLKSNYQSRFLQE